MSDFKTFLQEHNVDVNNKAAVGQMASHYLRLKDKSFTEEEKPWVNECLQAVQQAMEDYQRKKKLNTMDKLLPSLFVNVNAPIVKMSKK